MSIATARSTQPRPGTKDYIWNGEIVTMAPPSTPHANVVFLLSTLLTAIFPPDEHMVWTEQGLILEPDVYEPLPDVMVIRGTVMSRRGRPLEPSEVVLIAEVSWTTLGMDCYVKPTRYSRFSLQPYLVADVKGQRVLVYSDADPAAGRYHTVMEYGRGESVPVAHSSIAVDDLYSWMDA